MRAITLNNKIDESRDFADMVQRSMVRRLSSRNKQLRDLGVKQAPFVVLIGAAMPSVLAEISFVTNKQEGQLLKTGAYRQQIAEALLDAWCDTSSRSRGREQRSRPGFETRPSAAREGGFLVPCSESHNAPATQRALPAGRRGAVASLALAPAVRDA